MVDPTVASSIDTILKGAGFVGLAALALGWVCHKFYNRIQELQDKRVLDAQKYAEGMAQAVATIRDQTATINRLADVLEEKR